jgi:hypothetical protein
MTVLKDTGGRMKLGNSSASTRKGSKATSRRYITLEATVKTAERTKAMLAILKMDEAEIREGEFRNIDEFLTELGKKDAGTVLNLSRAYALQCG